MFYYKPSTHKTAPAQQTQVEMDSTSTVVNSQPAQAATMKMEHQEAKRLRGGCG
ncbi:hypothetical protein FRB97_002075, partial [Tulasnella sp. 331]